VVEEDNGSERGWIIEKLEMGNLSKVTSAVRKVDSGKESGDSAV
jgi:hypothetical protein